MYYDLNKLKKIFDRFTQYKAPDTAFSDILDYALLPFQYFPTNAELLAAHHKLTCYKHISLVQEFLTELAELNPEGFGDPLGEFYMLEISHGRLGQYFTPEHISDMMAIMTYDKPKDLSGKTVLDPACGSGRTLLSLAKLNRKIHCYGADLDLTCCKMSLLNMLLNSLTGEIAHMNTLSNEFFTGFRFSTKLINGYHYPFFEAFNDPNSSTIWMRPLPATPVTTWKQGLLFDDM